ncbi:hypothetical protein, conserved [Eimeria necatrix]|uniref:SAP domain-containing protein n=1 Tax=Eimeria necatrix TaxID=51315 RepID=U6N2D3_9EIME|nr:hypothetical protein, conserved [Eimeria necatrix]CDJ68075.1 hypothetical protein, conserved [Eimeria necatrix]
MKCRLAVFLLGFLLCLVHNSEAASLTVWTKGNSRRGLPGLLLGQHLAVAAGKEVQRKASFAFTSAAPRSLVLSSSLNATPSRAKTASTAKRPAVEAAALPADGGRAAASKPKRKRGQVQREAEISAPPAIKSGSDCVSGQKGSQTAAPGASDPPPNTAGAVCTPVSLEDAGAADSTSPPNSSNKDGLCGVPITGLRTACRKMQLPSKGTRSELIARLLAVAPTQKILAFVAEQNDFMQQQQQQQAQDEAEGTAELPVGASSEKPTPSRCHRCNHRLSSKARFCSKCGATINLLGQETLREFVEKAFWPVREQEVGSNTMRVERGFWQSILQVIGDVPVANLSSAVWEKYLGVLKKRSCSPRTQVLHQVAYLAALKYAVHTRRLESIHPFRKIRGCTKRTLVSVPLTAEEVYLLLAATPNTMHCALFAVGIGAGLRPSEILSMRWEDVNMNEMTATIRGSKTAASAAAIPLTNLAGRELMRWWEEEGKPTSGLCFYAEGIRTAESRAKLEKKTPIRSFKKALQAAAQR